MRKYLNKFEEGGKKSEAKECQASESSRRVCRKWTWIVGIIWLSAGGEKNCNEQLTETRAKTSLQPFLPNFGETFPLLNCFKWSSRLINVKRLCLHNQFQRFTQTIKDNYVPLFFCPTNTVCPQLARTRINYFLTKTIKGVVPPQFLAI